LSTISKPEVFIVATPIGNPEDITLRAIRVLKNVDLVICEEAKVGSKLLNRLKIDKPLELLNEHNEKNKSYEIFLKIAQDKLSVAIISDSGTPLFADPGTNLVNLCLEGGITVRPVPGASSLMACLMSAGIKIDRFFFHGFLSNNSKRRIQELKKLPLDTDIIFLEAPYRLKFLLKDMIKVLGRRRRIILAYRLTYPEEKILRGTLAEISRWTQNLSKGEFVLILRRIKG